MHDIRIIREAPEAFDAALARRGLAPVSPAILALDEKRRGLILAAETALAERNAASKAVGAAKARGDEAEFERLRALVGAKKDEIAGLETGAAEADAALRDMLMGLPNLPLAEIPDGKDEADNVEIRRWGTPPALDFAPRQHFEIAEAMGLMDFELAAKLSGARFVVLKGALARVHRALAQFMVDTHVDENGLTEMWTPVLVRDEAMRGTGQLPKFAEDSFFGASMTSRGKQLSAVIDQKSEAKDIKKIRDKETLNSAVSEILDRADTHEEFWLIPTAEVTLTNTVAGEILGADALPRRMVAWTQCFRSEAGSAGKDTRGMLRQHQFEKVEMVSIVRPEDGLAEHERMTRCAEGILEALGLPYRTVVLCAGDMGFGAVKTHDLEVWLPGQGTYREISSVSLCGAFQARRMNARFRREEGARPEFAATLNGSGLAVGRCLIAVLENGQQADGSVALPPALAPYLRGAVRITAEGALA